MNKINYFSNALVRLGAEGLKGSLGLTWQSIPDKICFLCMKSSYFCGYILRRVLSARYNLPLLLYWFGMCALMNIYVIEVSIKYGEIGNQFSYYRYDVDGLLRSETLFSKKMRSLTASVCLSVDSGRIVRPILAKFGK